MKLLKMVVEIVWTTCIVLLAIYVVQVFGWPL